MVKHLIKGALIGGAIALSYPLGCLIAWWVRTDRELAYLNDLPCFKDGVTGQLPE